MRVFSRLSSVALLGLLASARPATAQLVRDCRPNSNKTLATGVWAALGDSAVKAKLTPMLEQRRWTAALDTLSAMFSRSPADLSALSAADRATLAAQLDSTRREFLAAETRLELRDMGAFAERFKPTAGITGIDGFVLFNGRGRMLIVTDSMTETTRRSVCWLGWSVSDLIALLRQPGIQRIADAFVRLDSAWDNYMNHGYSMLPLELFLNGKLMRRAHLEPPRAQLIALHTSVATQMFVTSWKDSDRDEVLALEPLGILRYTDDRRGYFGVSAIATFPRNGGPGGGLMVHSTTLGHIAALVRRDENNKTRFGALLSIDLYKRVFGVADKVKSIKAEKLATCVALRDRCADSLKQ